LRGHQHGVVGRLLAGAQDAQDKAPADQARPAILLHLQPACPPGVSRPRGRRHWAGPARSPCAALNALQRSQAKPPPAALTVCVISLLSRATSCEELSGSEKRMPGVWPCFRRPLSLCPVTCRGQAFSTSASAACTRSPVRQLCGKHANATGALGLSVPGTVGGSVGRGRDAAPGGGDRLTEACGAAAEHALRPAHALQASNVALQVSPACAGCNTCAAA